MNRKGTWSRRKSPAAHDTPCTGLSPRALQFRPRDMQTKGHAGGGLSPHSRGNEDRRQETHFSTSFKKEILFSSQRTAGALKPGQAGSLRPVVRNQ